MDSIKIHTGRSPLPEALDRLVDNGTLTTEQALAVLAAAGSPQAARPSWTGLLSELGGYVGGAFVVAGVAVFLGPNWQHLSPAARLAVLGGPAPVLAVAAVLVARGTPGGWTVHERRGTTSRRRLVSALILVAAGLGGGVAAVLNPGSDDGLAYFATATVLLVIGYLFCRGFVLHAALAAAAAITTISLVTQLVRPGVDGTWQAQQLWTGLALVALGALWAALSLAGVLDEAALGLFAAGVITFVAGELLALGPDGSQWAGFLVLALLASACLAAYARLHHVLVLAVGVVALATVAPQAIIHYTNGALGAAGGLLVVGLSIVGASAAGLRLRKEVSREGAAVASA